MATLQHTALLEVCREAGLSDKLERIILAAEGFARESISRSRWHTAE